ncbi:MAG: hypothetical protein HC836_35095 [Richelia sp. RM2_1_2]|nr:hypothetical protein [Richelia sp. RM2_1_2]
MNKNNWIKNTAFFFTFLSLLTVKIPQALAENSTGNSTIYLAKTSAYDRYMARGYAATRSRNYRQALGYFQQALQVRPGDRYARAAINNVQGYINRISRRNIRIIAGKPGPTKGGASRGEACIQLDKTIIAVTPVPKDNKNSSEDSQNDTDKEEAPKLVQLIPHSFFMYL